MRCCFASLTVSLKNGCAGNSGATVLHLGRAVLNLSYITDRKLNRGSIYDLQPVGLGNLGRRVNIDLSFYKKTYGNKYAAWFAQVGYHGSDPYNLYFQQSVLFYRVGIAGRILKWTNHSYSIVFP